MSSDKETFIRANLAVGTAPLVPEIQLYLAGEITPIWQATAADLEAACRRRSSRSAGQALARHILDNLEIFRGKRVLDFGAGGGVASIALAMAGASTVTASEIDPFAIAAMKLNVAFEIVDGDLTREQNQGSDIEVASWLRKLAATGATVLMVDPGREYLPKDDLAELASYEVPTSRELEDSDACTTVLWRVQSD